VCLAKGAGEVALIREAGRKRDLDDRQRSARELATGVLHAQPPHEVADRLAVRAAETRRDVHGTRRMAGVFFASPETRTVRAAAAIISRMPPCSSNGSASGASPSRAISDCGNSMVKQRAPFGPKTFVCSVPPGVNVTLCGRPASSREP